MIKWYLVLYVIGGYSSMTTIPQYYNDKQACEEAAKDWDSSFQKHICVKVPVRSACTCTGTFGVYPCECSVHTDGYVCQPGAPTCEVVK